MRIVIVILVGLIITSCAETVKPADKKLIEQNLNLSQEQAERLAALPLKCMQQEYPNKLGQVLNGDDELLSPKRLHPAFYGCFDWHSAVHGQWLMVRLLKQFPTLKEATRMRQVLGMQLTAENIAQELKFFHTKYNESFERTYGWVWILKLQQELAEWKDADGKQWTKNLQPLSDLIVQGYLKFLPKLNYPIRTGEHINTAFGLTYAFDYAVFSKNEKLKKLIEKRAKDFYLKDRDLQLRFEPSGYDFLSPAMEEVDLMRRVLAKKEFMLWLNQFLPELRDSNFNWEPGKVSDRTDGKLVHLDGLNFSRAWCLYGISRVDASYRHLRQLADQHLAHSLPSIVDGDYMGEHWLATFAVTALLERNNQR